MRWVACWLGILGACSGSGGETGDAGAAAAGPSSPEPVGAINPWSSFATGGPILALPDDRGGIVIAWETCAAAAPCSDETLWARRFDASTGWSKAVVLTSSAEDYDLPLELLTLPDGDVLATWHASSGTMAARYHPPVGWLAPQALPAGARVTLGPEGTAWLAYCDDSGAVLARLDEPSKQWVTQASGGECVSSDLGFAGADPILFTTDIGALVSTRWIRGVGWTLKSSTPADVSCVNCQPALLASDAGSFATLWGSHGFLVLAPGAANATSFAGVGAMAATPDGHALLASALTEDGAQVVVTRTYAGGVWSGPTRLAGPILEEMLHPAVALRARGDGWVVWLEGAGTQFTLRAAPVDVRGATGPAVDVAGVPVSAYAAPTVVVDAAGIAWVLWIQDRAGGSQVYLRRLSR
jgi:hypothetical protein